MNRLRVKNQMGEMAKWLLAGAYATCNKQDMARQIYQNLNKMRQPWNGMIIITDQDVRDWSLVSSVLFDAGDKDIAIQVMTDLIGKVNKRRHRNQSYCSIQSVKYFGKNSMLVQRLDSIVRLLEMEAMEDLSTNRSIPEEKY
ncbi:MAG: hypothetical protein U0T81_13015 [Saprospiraceae bacterium]